ncbi:type II CRISPR RNA-guided endonuclease Cas9 [Methylovorus mays]|uniref:type II CRISPR RNA-guided endonuclease Cas9 n=1 Tax=Methylovorus mays TaxID=184077 RepID=UPI001E2FCA4E|nr:type II CRISPR RNA-guided endonuclease Cas9 [Methylovorus mays]MCB5207430.1 type II CRISPR RNA-guided endonuclease Cas9 [Methylovorus mays]
MRYRLGLDVGTASLGIAAVSLNHNNEPQDLIWSAIRIFDEPLEKSQSGLISKKAGRRAARMQRRQIDRRSGRTKRIAALAKLIGIAIAPSIDSGSTLLEVRARAAREQIDLSDLMRIFIRYGKRRGYAGEFRHKKENAKLGEVEGGSKDLEDQMKALAESRGVTAITIGEYLYHRWQQGLPTKLKIKENRTDDSSPLPNLYALRKQVEAEFEQVWQTQSAFYPCLQSQHDGVSVKEIFHAAIFHQRSLKGVGSMVGQCGLEPTLSRAPRAQLAFQHFRIEKTLADLRWGAGKRATALSGNQKAVIRSLLDERDVVGFKAIYDALEKNGCQKPEGLGLNLDRLSRDELPGNKTNHVFRKLGLYDEWCSLGKRTQVQAINFLADLGSPEQLDDPLWHIRFSKQDGTQRLLDPEFVNFINRLKQSEKFDHLVKMGFDGGRASYSIKALNRLTEWLANPWWPENGKNDMRLDEDAAIRACYPKSQDQSRVQLTRLSAPKLTGNAVVDGSLRQIRFVINRMIDELGAPPYEIVVEMAREMSVGVSKRNERESENNKSRAARKDAEKAISDHGATVTSSRVRRYLLWREQGEKFCPYCERTITLADALNGAETEYEHILPRSLTQVGMKRSEIVLAHRSCNQEKGNRTPYEAWGQGRDNARWAIIEHRAEWFEKNRQFRKARLLRLQNFEVEVLNDESIAGFADRQFHQTSWIAKEAALWLQSISAKPVSVSRGELTAMLRRKWKLETVIPQARITENLPILDEEGSVITPEEFERYRGVWEGHRAKDKSRHTDRRLNKRIDHRHHLIDAITIALTSRSLFQRMAQQYKLDSELVANGERPRLQVVEPPLKNIRELALHAIKNCPLSIKPDHYPDGAMFQETAYGVAQKDGEDKLRLTLRTSLATLVDRKKGTVEQARKAISSIVSDTIRELIFKVFETRIATGYTAPAALAEPIYQTLYGKPIQVKKVCCYTDKYAEDVMLIRHVSKDGREHIKRLLHNGYAYLETEISEGRIIRQAPVTIQQAIRYKKQKTAEGVKRLYKGDTVIDMEDGKTYRICFFKAAGTIALLPICEPRSFKEANEKASKECKVGKTVSFRPAARRLKVVNL